MLTFLVFEMQELDIFRKNPVDTRRCFNVDMTSYNIVRRRIDVETTSCIYREAKTYLEPSQVSMIQLFISISFFAKKVKGFGC